MKHLVLSAYPLTAAFKEHLQASLAPACVRWLTLSQLRQGGSWCALSLLREERWDTAWAAVEDTSIASLQPVLQVAAGLSQAVHLGRVDADGTLHSLPRGTVLAALQRFAGVSARGLLDVLHSAWLVRLLPSMARRPTSPLDVPRPLREVLYLKTNLMLGVKAGGSLGHVAGVIQELVARGMRVTYAASEPPAGVAAAVEHLVVPPLACYGWPLEVSYHAYSRHFLTHLLASLQRRPSFIYQRHSICNLSGVSLARHLNVPLVLEYNGPEVAMQRLWGRPLAFERLARRIEDACLQQADLVVTVSELLAEDVRARGVDPRRIVWHPNGVDVERFDPQRLGSQVRREMRERVGLGEADCVVGFVGTFGVWHGVELLARVIRRMADAGDGFLSRQRVHFLLMGDGDRMDAVCSVLGDARGRWCTLTGLVPQHEAPAWLAACDVVASPHVPNPDGTRFFGSPTKLFEYMAMGRAIVAADLEQLGALLQPALHAAALPEGAPPSQSEAVAILHPPGDEEALERCLRFAIERADWRAALGSRARERAVQRHTWKQHVDAILQRLVEIC